MTNDELEAVRARLAKATDGPWYRSGIRGRMGDLECFRVFDGNEQWFASVSADTTNGPMHARSLADAEFIAHARTDIPALLDALTRAEAHAERLAGALEFITDEHVDRENITTAQLEGLRQALSRSADGEKT